MPTNATHAYTGPVNANGVTPIPFDFQGVSATEIEVWREGVAVDPSTYSVSMNDDGTGTITPASSWGTDEVVIFSDPTYAQPANFPRHVPLYPDQVTVQFDKTARRILALLREVNRAVQVPFGEDGFELPSDRANKFLAFDSSKQAIATAISSVYDGSQILLASSRVALAALTDAEDDQAAFLGEAGREGIFKWSSADLSAHVAIDTDQGVYVAPSTDASGASGAWVRETSRLEPEHFGLDTAANATLGLLRMIHLAQLLDLPCWSSGASVIPIGAAVEIKIGSLDGTTAPAAGFLDGLQMLGRWELRLLSGLEGVLQFNDGNWLFFGDFNADISTEATNGKVKLEFQSCYHVYGNTASKIGQAGNGFTTGGAMIGLHGSTEFVRFEEVIAEHAGPNASAVIVVDANNFHFGKLRCVGGQDGLDVSGVSGLTSGQPQWSVDEVYFDGLDAANTEGVDLGNASGGRIDRVIAVNCDDAVVLKTENSGQESLGTNDVRIGEVIADEFAGDVVSMQAGATADQTLHNIEIGRIVARSTRCTAASRAIRFAQGDVALDPTSGFKLGSAVFECNDGATFDINGMVDFTIENVVSNMPTAIINSASSNFGIENQNGLFRNCQLTGDITCALRGVTFDNVVTSGRFRVTEGRHNDYISSGVLNSQTLGFDLLWTQAGDKDVDMVDCFAENVGLDGSANQYALGCWRNGAAIAVTGIRIRDFTMRDMQRSLAFTSGGTVEPQLGDRVYDNVTGAEGIINKITLTSGSWAAGDAAGTLLLRDVVGEFAAASTLTLRDQAHEGGTGVLSADVATASGASVAAPTSAGLRLTNLTSDNCKLVGLMNEGIADSAHLSYGFEGARSVNANNRIKASTTRTVGAAHTLQMQDANSTLQMTANFNVTLNGNGPVFPLGTVFYIQNQSGAAVNLATSNGAVINSAGALLGVAQDGEVELRIVGHSPLTAQARGDLI